MERPATVVSSTTTDRSPWRGRQRRRHQRRTGVNGSGPSSIQLGRGPHTCARQLAVRHPGTRQTALRLVSTTAQRDNAGPLLVVTAAAASTPARSRCSGPPTPGAASGHQAGSLQFADVGASPPGVTCALPMSRSRAPPPRSGSSPATRIWRRSTGSGSHRRGSHSCARCRTWWAPRTRCFWTGWSVWRSRAAAVRPSERRHRDAEVAHPAGSVRC